jgi:hypothetical protein
VPFTISHRPAPHEGWAELLAHGLAFDLVGLAPAGPAPAPQPRHHYGIAACHGEAVTLQPGAHLSGGEGLLPVVRTTAALGSALAGLDGVVAVVWHPARSACAPALFRAGVDGWLAGGAFPVLALASLELGADGAFRSEGLAFLLGQELRLDSLADGDSAKAGKIAARLIHTLVEEGAVLEAAEFTGPGGERLRAQPTDNGRILRVSQNGDVTRQ